MPCARAFGSVFAAAILASALCASVPARADIDVRIDIGNAPPAPQLVFHARPHERYDPRARVYLVDDPGIGNYDCFRYGGYYWLFNDGYWYRSRSWRGGFVVIQPRYVPSSFYRVAPTRWKHHPTGPPGHNMMRPGATPPGHAQMGGGGPPGQAKKGDNGRPGQSNQGGKGQDKQGGRGGK
jgi:hypothetical protein